MPEPLEVLSRLLLIIASNILYFSLLLARYDPAREGTLFLKHDQAIIQHLSFIQVGFSGKGIQFGE